MSNELPIPNETPVEMVRRTCNCGNVYWVEEEEDDGRCYNCFLADEQDARLNALRGIN